MAHDLVIRGGEVVDGSGSDPVQADIAITGDRITAMGRVAEAGTEEIDATGHLVTPGFVDIHTHLDAQIGWDPLLTPVSWHGVTTALLGNCGVTFAPCKPADREFLASMMETVEDIPRDAILNGLSWDWEHYAGYLDALEHLQPAINVGGLVGHCAVRYYVMGERSIEEAASAEDKRQMAQIAGDAVKAGAVGFSTSRFLGHYIPDGRHVPGTHAEHDELVRIAEAVGAQGGLMQNVLNLGGDFEGEMSLLEAQARAAGVRVLFSTGAGSTSGWGNKVADRVNALRSEGLDINAVSIPRGSGFITGMQCMLAWGKGAWQELKDLDLAGRVAAINNPEMFAKLVADAKANPTRLETDQIFFLGAGDKPNYVSPASESLQAIANASGEHPAETYLRIARETGGQALFVVRLFNKNLDALSEVISSDYCLPGLGDAGAHVGQIMDSGWATFVLSHWVRDAGLYTTAEAIRRLTSAPARIMGLHDRGILACGMKADVNVIDASSVHERMPEMVHDFPGGAKRFIQRAVGYKATICNGQVILRDDELTGNRNGQILRNQATGRGIG